MTDSAYDAGLDDRKLRSALEELAEQSGPPGSLDRQKMQDDVARRARRRRFAATTSGVLLAVVAAVAVPVFLMDRVGGSGHQTAAPGTARPPGTPSGGPSKVAVGPDPEGLHYLSEAVLHLGQDEYGDIYGGMKVDDCKCSLTVYLTDIGRQGEFLAALQQRTSPIAPGLVTFTRSMFTTSRCRQLTGDVMDALAARSLPFVISRAWTGSGCSALNLGVDDVAAAQVYFADPANLAGFEGLVIAVEFSSSPPVLVPNRS
ncbi:hypothetical protein [Yinghuangia soli]|uniref:Uncharacterized protein n=1 Tax=Yinghuangia soli TaxID=2908204 RepID=A0AA41Q7M3_9ACTN|nr:hypothetical protein [Yinghuangia soli]MCF2533003.1 hypothetical protein [Yinghuangia soli]